MESLRNPKTSRCIICNKIRESGKESNPNENEEEDVNFLFRILLEIPPKPGISLVVDGNLINADHLLLLKSNLVRWCYQCSIGITQARKLYQQIKEATEKFRKIQRESVETLQKCIQDDDSSSFDKDENYKAIWRKLCLHNEGRFNQFDYPFTVQNWTPSLPSASPPSPTKNKDSHNESSSCHGDDVEDELACKNEDHVKTEEDEDDEEVEPPKQQRILLIFPEEDGDNAEDEGGSLSSGSHLSDDEDKDDDEVVIESNTNEADEDDPLADNLKKEPQPDLGFRDKPEQSLVSHQKRHHSSGTHKPKRVQSTSITAKLKCLDPKCQKAFKNFANLRLHIKKRHPQIPIPTQRKLSAFHKKYPELYSKIVRNPETKLFTCPFSTGDGHTTAGGPTCSMTSKKKETIEIHVRSKHLGETDIYPCTWGHGCTKSFTFYENYRYHMGRHKGNPRWKCDPCDKQFYSRNSFVRHQQVEHEDGKNRKHFICGLCGKAFSCRDNLYYHNHKSTSCKDKAKASSNKEVKVKEGDCDICGKFVKNVKSHKKNVHPTTRKFMCHLCPKSSKSAAHLKLHLKRHEDTSPKDVRWSAQNKFKCSVKGCSLRFPRTELLESHMKSRHGEDGEKEPEFKCQYCGKGYHLRQVLKHHEETHENEGKDPHECNECGKRFRTMVYLKYHLRHTHKMKLEDKRKVAKI